MDLTVHFPSEGVIRLRSRLLFGNPDSPTCRKFLERVFLVEEVSNVSIKAGEAELKYCPKTYALKQVVGRVAAFLSGRDAPPLVTNGHVKAKGHARANGYATSNGHSSAVGTMTHPAGPNGDRSGNRLAANGHPDQALNPNAGGC